MMAYLLRTFEFNKACTKVEREQPNCAHGYEHPLNLSEFFARLAPELWSGDAAARSSSAREFDG